MMGCIVSLGHRRTVDRKSRPGDRVGLVSVSLFIDRGIIVKIRALFLVPILTVGLVSCSSSDSKSDSSTADSVVTSTPDTAPSVTEAPMETGFTAVTPTTAAVGDVTVEGPITVSNRVPLPDFLAGVPTSPVVLAGVPFEAEKFLTDVQMQTAFEQSTLLKLENAKLPLLKVDYDDLSQALTVLKILDFLKV